MVVFCNCWRKIIVGYLYRDCLQREEIQSECW